MNSNKQIETFFLVTSDAMFDGTINSISKGSKLKGVKLPKKSWESYFLKNDCHYLVIEATLFKRPELVKIREYKEIEGYITCYFLNPIKKDIRVPVESIQALHYITHETREISKNLSCGEY